MKTDRFVDPSIIFTDYKRPSFLYILYFYNYLLFYIQYDLTYPNKIQYKIIKCNIIKQ